jgi:RNA polymerase sigma factor (sigma-70 family)
MASCSTGAYGMVHGGSASGSARRKDSRVGADGAAWLRVRRALAGRSGARTRAEAVPRHTETSPDAWATALYAAHYEAVVRFAALLIGDIAVAERVVQDAFVALYNTRRRQDSDRALFYLRRAVIRRSRSVGRRATLRGDASQPVLGRAMGGQQVTAASPGYSAMISALYRLPAHQREAVLLRYYSELPEEQIANVMGLSKRAVARLLERARVSLPTPPAGAAPGSA